DPVDDPARHMASGQNCLGRAGHPLTPESHPVSIVLSSEIPGVPRITRHSLRPEHMRLCGHLSDIVSPSRTKIRFNDFTGLSCLLANKAVLLGLEQYTNYCHIKYVIVLVDQCKQLIWKDLLHGMLW